MKPTSRVLRALCCLALTTPSLAKPASWLVCDTNEFVETLWPKYAAAHAAAVAALRNDAPPGAWRGHRYFVCSVSSRGLGNKLLYELMPCARVAVATGRALVVRTERHIAEALGGVDFAAAPGEAPAIAWLAPGLADACPGSPGACNGHELVCDQRRPAHLPALCGRRRPPKVVNATGNEPIIFINQRSALKGGRATGRCVPEDGVLAAAFFPLAAGVRDAAATFLRRAAGDGGAYAAFHARVGAYAFHSEREALEVFETAVWGLLERAHKEPTAADWQCYAARYPDVGAAFGRNVGALARHHYRHGFAEGRNPYCEAALHGDALVEAAFGALNASRARDPGFVGVVLRKFHDAVAIARRAGGPVVVLSDSAAVAPLLKRAYPEVRLVAPPGEPGHVNPSRAPAVRTNAMPGPTALLRKALLDLLVIGAAADLRASHHSTFHASARKLFAPGPINKLRPRPPDPPTLARVVLIDVRPDVDERHASKLHAVAANLCEKLPGTPVVFFHHSAAAAAAAALARAHACVGRTTAVDAQIPGLEGFSVGRNVRQYNALLKTEAFWRSIGEDRDTVLLAQADSGICGAGAAVEAFARYDYCGAVTRFGVVWAPTQNGGFSIRNVGCMRRVIRAFAAGAFRDGNTRRGGLARVAEDAFFTQGAALFCDKCPAAVAREFAEETLHVHNATTREPEWTSKYASRKFSFHAGAPGASTRTGTTVGTPRAGRRGKRRAAGPRRRRTTPTSRPAPPTAPWPTSTSPRPPTAAGPRRRRRTAASARGGGAAATAANGGVTRTPRATPAPCRCRNRVGPMPMPMPPSWLRRRRSSRLRRRRVPRSPLCASTRGSTPAATASGASSSTKWRSSGRVGSCRTTGAATSTTRSNAWSTASTSAPPRQRQASGPTRAARRATSRPSRKRSRPSSRKPRGPIASSPQS